MNNDILKIRGGKPIEGEVAVYGAKNAISKIMVAALLTSEPCVLRNVSWVVDTNLMMNVIPSLGGEVEKIGERDVKITAKTLHGMDNQKFQEVVGKSRVPILLCGPLLSRHGQALIPALGGCVIGDRPVDFHISALRKLGAKVEERTDGIYFSAEKLQGAPIRLHYPSVGATEQVLLNSVTAEGTTELSNAAIEPEILDLVAVLNKMGADITPNDRTYIIRGVKKLGGFDHTPIPDRLEVASWACIAAATNGRIYVENANPEHLHAFLEKFDEAGCGYSIQDNGITFWRKGEKMNPARIETNVYPGFATDWQQPLTIPLTLAEGESHIHETVYENRFGHIDSVNKMGADITLIKECRGTLCRFNNEHFHTAIIKGGNKLHGEDIEVPDLRGGFSYVVAAAAADGVTTIRNVSLLKRGYEDFISKLSALGVDMID